MVSKDNRSHQKDNLRRRKKTPAGTPRNSFRKTIKPDEEKPVTIRLNKYIANAGICSRREADKLIISGAIRVNGKVVADMGVKISPSDKVQYEDETIRTEKKFYVLLNKPKGYITTTADPFDRKTVMFLVQNACKERIYPVGRLDKDTTGVLLLTNDGDIAKKLTHPKHRVNKVYHVELDKNLKLTDMQKIASGIELEDGTVRVDAIAFAQGATSKKDIGIEIHTGKNRIVRRIFESLGYRVVKLDRSSFAGLTKKDIPRGKWRHLSDKEIGFLKMI
jgi:23S rRNA pseudouridine2605 synthase